MNEDVSDSEDGGLPRDSLAPRRATKSQKAGEKMQDLARRLLRFNPRFGRQWIFKFKPLRAKIVASVSQGRERF